MFSVTWIVLRRGVPNQLAYASLSGPHLARLSSSCAFDHTSTNPAPWRRFPARNTVATIASPRACRISCLQVNCSSHVDFDHPPVRELMTPAHFNFGDQNPERFSLAETESSYSLRSGPETPSYTSIRFNSPQARPNIPRSTLPYQSLDTFDAQVLQAHQVFQPQRVPSCQEQQSCFGTLQLPYIIQRAFQPQQQYM
jgi:hypothetical protein